MYRDFIPAAPSPIASIISLAITVLTIVAMWKIYAKAGVPGWSVLIPFYNAYMQFKFTWKTKMFWWLMICIIAAVVLALVVVTSAVATPTTDALTIGLGLVMMACIIAAVVIALISTVKLAKAFGLNGAFAVGLLFLNVIFLCILAFGDAKYVGKHDE